MLIVNKALIYGSDWSWRRGAAEYHTFYIYHQEYTIGVSRWFVNLNVTYTCQSGIGSHELSTE